MQFGHWYLPVGLLPPVTFAVTLTSPLIVVVVVVPLTCAAVFAVGGGPDGFADGGKRTEHAKQVDGISSSLKATSALNGACPHVAAYGPFTSSQLPTGKRCR